MQKRNLHLNEPGRDIAASLFTATADKSGLLFVHGYESSKKGYREYASEVANSIGSSCLTLDLGGHGKSKGNRENLTINDHLAELRNAYDYLSSRTEVNPKRIGIVGASYGGFLAVLLSEDRHFKGMLLRAPAIYPNGLENTARKNFDTAGIDRFRRDMDPDTPNRALRAVANFAGQIALVRSEHDESIPGNVIDVYSAMAQNSTVIDIPGAHHSLEGPERQVFKKIVTGFANQL